MMTFKDALESDIDNVFLNLEEFAVEVDFNWQVVTAIVDDSYGSFDSGSGQGFADASGLGLQVTSRTLRIRQVYAAGLMPEQGVTLDGGQWVVDSVKIEDGIAVVALRQGYA